MKTNAFPLVAFLAAGAVAVAGWYFFTRSAPRESAPPPLAPARTSEPSEPTPAARASELRVLSQTAGGATPPTSSTTPSAEIATVAPAPAGNAAAAAPAKPKKPKAPLQAPLARAAMAFVGIDEDAEAVWIEAVFDTRIAEKEREDLMEDLNEEGLSDPKRPGPQDYARIMNRIALIDRLTPDADPFVLRHLQEARKDLLNLAAIIQGQGQPVR